MALFFFSRLKSKELSIQLDRARRLISELENKLLQKETEFESYKDKIQSQSSETQLQAELGLMKLEKVREEGRREGGRVEYILFIFSSNRMN